MKMCLWGETNENITLCTGIDTIIVKDLSRFGRDYIGVGEYMEQIFPLLGVRLIAINDNYDSNNYKGTTLGMLNCSIIRFCRS